MIRTNTRIVDITKMAAFVALFLLVSAQARAATTVTVDSTDKVTVTQPVIYIPTATPVVIAREVTAGDFEGRIVSIDYAKNEIQVLEANGRQSLLSVTPEVINHYRVGDYVLVHPTTDLTVMKVHDNPKDFEGDIIRVNMSDNEIVVLDTTGRERRVQLKQGMIGTYKVDDYVRIHLMEDLKEAKTIETIKNVRSFEGNIVSVDAPRSVIVVRDTRGNTETVLVRQGLIGNYGVGQSARIYTLPDRNEAQLVRVIR